MKSKLFCVMISLAVSSTLFAGTKQTNMEERKSPDGLYTYKIAPDDPMAVRIYTLKNGLTVMLSVNKAEPRIQTFIAVKAGSKNDPHNNTGLAHYLEHMMFKGTDKYGTKDYNTEKIYLDQIDQLYETYNHTTDEAKRKEIYKQIDSVSGIAAKYAIANEYDKMTQSIGATGTNAFTSVEETVYVNNIPSNELENWLTIESERFRNPVFRIFHTELEAVYEEKNRGLDNDDVKVDEALMSGLFKNHPYGTQTTIGTVEHLKNPSLKKIKEYFHTYYVPNNMAIIMSGDFDPDQTIKMIDKYFAGMQPKNIPPFSFKPEEPRNKPEEKTALGPKAEEVMMAYRFPGAGTKEALLLKVTNYMLSNDKAGIMDINLVKDQKVLEAGADIGVYKDYSVQYFQGEPKEGQKLEEVRDLILAQIEKLKKGDFDDDLLQSVINNMQMQEIYRQENNNSRVYIMMDAFVTGRNWEDAVHDLENARKLTKKDIVDFANKYYTNDYVVVYKRIGEDKSIVKVDKPPITQVSINRDEASPFAQSIINASAKEISPVFLDYKKDINHGQLKTGIPVYSVKNTENKRFTLYYTMDMGKNNDNKLPVAVEYLKFIGTDKYSAEQISREFYKLGCNFGIYTAYDRTTLYVTGLQENFDKAVDLFEHLLANAKPDQKALDGVVSNLIQERNNMKKNKDVILRQALVMYAKYGAKNPFNNNLSEAQLKGLKADEMVNYIHKLNSYEHRIYYYGPEDVATIEKKLNDKHKVPAKLNPIPEGNKFVAHPIDKNKVYFVNFDMVQANIYWVAKDGEYNTATLPVASVFNEYFGGSMGSIVFQTLRESKALAYATSSRFETPSRREDPFFTTAYIGTQSDKMNEAINSMNDLLRDMPTTDLLLDNARKGLRSQIEAQRIIRQDILMNYDQAMRMGQDHDVRRDIYASLDKINMNDIRQFHKENCENRNYNYCVLASKEKINENDLTKYGTLEELTLQQIFGY